MDVELGVLEKRIRRSQRPKIQLLLATVAHLAACLVIFGFHDRLYRGSTYGSAGLVSAAMSGLSQGLLQLLTNKVDFASVLKFDVWGVINGVWTRFWTEQLFNRYERAPMKILWDQLLGNPLGVLIFTSLSAFWEGYDVDLYLQKNYLPALKISLLVWPLASVAQFLVVPQKYIVLFNTVINFAWTVILGLLT